MIFDPKIRLRSDSELKIQNEGLVIIKNLLDNIKITSFLSSGTLLGAVREQDFIRWDWDVQMYLLMEEFLEYDHIVPFSKGGKTTFRNLQLLCRTHNRMKSDKEL
mgnify:CR=1 FL=1